MRLLCTDLFPSLNKLRRSCCHVYVSWLQRLALPVNPMLNHSENPRLALPVNPVLDLPEHPRLDLSVEVSISHSAITFESGVMCMCHGLQRKAGNL